MKIDSRNVMLDKQLGLMLKVWTCVIRTQPTQWKAGLGGDCRVHEDQGPVSMVSMRSM